MQPPWYEAVSFCRWLSTVPGFGECSPRLPVEEEWEVACRAGTESRFWQGNAAKDLGTVGWFGGNAGGRTHRVGGKAANDFGLYDVHGNVWEWTVSPWDSEGYQGRGKRRGDPRRWSYPFAKPPLSWAAARAPCGRSWRAEDRLAAMRKALSAGAAILAAGQFEESFQSEGRTG